MPRATAIKHADEFTTATSFILLQALLTKLMVTSNIDDFASGKQHGGGMFVPRTWD